MCTRCVLSQHARLNMQVLSYHAAMEKPTAHELYRAAMPPWRNPQRMNCTELQPSRWSSGPLRKLLDAAAMCACAHASAVVCRTHLQARASCKHPTGTSQTPHRHLTDTSQTPHSHLMVNSTQGVVFLFLNKRKKEGAILLFMCNNKNVISIWVLP